MTNLELMKLASQCITGGVNSPVRSFNGVGGTPKFIRQGQGAYIIDEEGKEFIDYVCSWGPLILGHAYPSVIESVISTLNKGLSFGAPTLIEIELAQLIKKHIPSIELIRMVNSGTEATMSAIRLARGYTGKSKIIKFAGCYHGHSDSLLVQAGSGALTFGTPTSLGVLPEAVAQTVVLPYNNEEEVIQCFEKLNKEIACVIVEPVAANMNCIPASTSFLQTLRKLCDIYQAILIFDEIITGFRVALGGAQALYGIKPDLTTLGKIIGGGMPVGAFGGSKAIMEYLAPMGGVYQAGTLSGNPVAMAAGLATIKKLEEPSFYNNLNQYTQSLSEGIQSLSRGKVDVKTQAVCGLFGIFFTHQNAITCLKEAQMCNLEHYQKFFHAMLNEGVYLAPSMYEAGFVSSAHSKHELNRTLQIIDKIFSTWQ